jgi:hypothetical protein
LKILIPKIRSIQAGSIEEGRDFDDVNNDISNQLLEALIRMNL